MNLFHCRYRYRYRKKRSETVTQSQTFTKNLKVLFALFLFTFSACDKPEKEKFGVHDHPLFLANCENALLASIFENPKEDPFRDVHLAWLKDRHPRLFAYAIENEELNSRDLVLAGMLSERFSINRDTTILFIGAEEAGLPRLFHDVFGIRSMVVIDLEACLSQAKKNFPLSSIRWIAPQEIDSSLKADLIVSTSLFSHLQESWQRRLFQTIFEKAKGGALFYEPAPRHWGVKVWKKERFQHYLQTRFEIESTPANSLTDSTRSIILFAH